MMEEWRDVIGYEGWYQVSNEGRVKRIKPGRGARAGHILKPAQDKDYLHVILCRNSWCQTRRIHMLVAEAFIGARPEGLCVNHKNGKKRDNRPSNLEWVTLSENMKHSYDTLGRQWKGPRGEKGGGAKLTRQQVKEIRRLYTTGKYTHKQLAKMFNVCKRNIGSILNRNSWKHI